MVVYGVITEYRRNCGPRRANVKVIFTLPVGEISMALALLDLYQLSVQFYSMPR